MNNDEQRRKWKELIATYIRRCPDIGIFRGKILRNLGQKRR
jgi:hypothetical protein